ncbi:DUF3883 domain-containing protein [Bradyrhizobium oligotrophicum S58]
MPAFEGLRLIRLYSVQHPMLAPEELVPIIKRVEPNAFSYDFPAALQLHDTVPKSAPYEGVDFYRECLSSALLLELPEWAKLVTLGRGRFIKRLKAPEFRDVRSLFRQARLLDEPPEMADIEWWDRLQASVRSDQDAEKMRRARQAEQLSLKYEVQFLEKAGITKRPIWMSIEDNTAGYDVLSYRAGGELGLLNRLIEVKSTIASPLRFFLTRNEWEQADQFADAFVFHIWNLQADPPVLFERSVEQVRPHVPVDNEKGKWKTAMIPVNL